MVAGTGEGVGVGRAVYEGYRYIVTSEQVVSVCILEVDMEPSGEGGG